MLFPDEASCHRRCPPDCVDLQCRSSNHSGSQDSYLENPNGSMNDIAGLRNREGNVYGMMPHPERAFYYYHVPEWQSYKNNEFADGYKLFNNAKKYFK